MWPRYDPARPNLGKQGFQVGLYRVFREKQGKRRHRLRPDKAVVPVLGRGVHRTVSRSGFDVTGWLGVQDGKDNGHTL